MIHLPTKLGPLLLYISLCLASYAQPISLEDPIAAAQKVSAQLESATGVQPKSLAVSVARTMVDPIEAAQVLAAAEKTFPNLSEELENATLLKDAVSNPSMKGNLRGRLAEKDWIERNARDGWLTEPNPIDPQCDAYRIVNGRRECAQVKVHNKWNKYIRSMEGDHEAERFILPDDHYELVYQELEKRRLGALRGGLAEKAEIYAEMQARLTKMGRTFSELEGALDAATKHYARIAKAIRMGGRAASFVAIALAVLDGGIAIYEVASGKADIEELITKVSTTLTGGTAAWALGNSAATAAVAAGATSVMIPVAVAIVVGGVTYLVIDWGISSAADSLRVAGLSSDDINRVWPDTARGVPLSRLYKKPIDAAILGKP
jgi:hypothetical protein